MLRILFAAFASVMLAVPALAAQLNDQTLAAPGFYNGSGNPSNNFAVDTETLGSGTIELGLRARFRGGPNVTPVGDLYTFPTGTGSGGRAVWNYDFSVGLGSSGYRLSDFVGTGGSNLLTASLTITDVNTAFTATINPVIYWSDSATHNGSTAFQNGSGYGSPGTMIGEQNSQNLQFADSPLAGDFNPWNGDTYLFNLKVSDSGGIIASVNMQVDAIPEPASLTLLSLGLAGMTIVRRRKAS